MRRTTLAIGPGAIVRVNGMTVCVKRWETADRLLVRDIMNSSERIVSLAEISESMAGSQTGPQLDLSSIDPESWELAIERFRVLEPLVGQPARSRADVEQAAAALLVSCATAYRWLSRIEAYGTVTCLLRKPRKDKGEKRLDEDVEQILRNVIASDYLTSLKRSPTLALREIRRRCRIRQLAMPSKVTLLRRIAEIVPEERERKRNGRNAALDYRAYRGTLPNVDHVHAIWQIDHTLVDIELVDEKDRIPIGRPWITVAIDVFTRMVVGWYVSFDPPGALGTGICIANAILPKDEWLVRLGVPYSWPCQGKPRTIQADNAKEFRGNMLKMACEEHGFDLKFRKVKKPNYGAHIERLLGTLAKEIHGLEGTTFSNPQVRGEYDSQKNAAMTLDEFELWLANLILGVYHQRPHSELDCAPIKRYNDGIFGDSETVGIGFLPIAADPEKLRIDFLPLEERTIQPFGVVLDHIQYHDAVLDKWIGATNPRSVRQARKFIFRRDPRNISYLFFWDPDVQRYYRIPYRDIRRPAISLWELRRIHTYLAEQRKKDIDEDMIFAALDEMRRIEEMSKDLTRKQRRAVEQRRRHARAAPSPTIPTSEVHLNDEGGGSAEPSSTTHRRFDPSMIKPFDEIEPM